jgi:restriction endonuclease Mrr
MYLSPVLRILRDGEDHAVQEIRQRILAEYPLTPEQLSLRRTGHSVDVFINKVALAFNRLVFHKAIVAGQAMPESYRITDHGREVLKRQPNDARERDL